MMPRKRKTKQTIYESQCSSHTQESFMERVDRFLLNVSLKKNKIPEDALNEIIRKVKES